MRLIVRPEAEADLLQAFAWYENRHVGLGHEFMEEVSGCLGAIGQRPLSFHVVDNLAHRAVLHRFPYALFFVMGEDASVVFAALHTAMDPAQLSRRVPPAVR